jgi:rhodanese-related sulfurtransferase
MLKGFGILAGVALITAFTVNHFSPVGIALVGDWDTRNGVISARAKNDVVVHSREIDTVQAAHALYEQKGVVFVDARPAEMFMAGHIKGAVSLPVDEADRLMEAFVEAHDPNTHIVTYCSGRECEDSHMLADKLTDYGFTHVQVFVDGFPAWKAEGYPVE